VIDVRHSNGEVTEAIALLLDAFDNNVEWLFAFIRFIVSTKL
jgi:hypothetical protein